MYVCVHICVCARVCVVMQACACGGQGQLSGVGSPFHCGFQESNSGGHGCKVNAFSCWAIPLALCDISIPFWLRNICEVHLCCSRCWNFTHFQGWIVFPCMECSHFIIYFHFLTILSSDAMTFIYMYLLCILNSSGHISRNRTADHTTILCLIFGGTTRPFSITAAVLYISVSAVLGLQLAHDLMTFIFH